MLLAKGTAAEAVEFYQKALDVRLAALGAEHVAVAEVRVNMALALARTEQLAAAQGHLELAVPVLTARLSAAHPAAQQASAALQEVRQLLLAAQSAPTS